MKKFNGYDETQSYTNSKKLPAGGYVLKVQNVRFEEGDGKYSDRISLMFDILEGEYKNFFQENFDSQNSEDKRWKGTVQIYCPKDDGTEQDNWTKKRFKTIMEHFELSNPGYSWNWDENTLKNKVIGGVFGEINTIIDGKDVRYIGFRFTEEVDNIRNNKFKIPAPQYKNGATERSLHTTSEDGFANIPQNANEVIPF